MKKLLLSISLLTIIISFQSCSKYPDNAGGSVFSKQFRLTYTDWASTEVIITSISQGVYEDDFTEIFDYDINFNADGTIEGILVADTRSINGQIVTETIDERWMWRNNKSEIHFPDNGGKETWEIRRLDLTNFWIVATDTETDVITEVKFEPIN
jgi:hypothetical protein